MKKFVYLFFIFVFSLCLCGCTNNETPSNIINVENIVINKSHAYANVGEKIVLLAQVFPFNAQNQNIIWQSDNDNIASVDDGIVFAKNEGRTVITAISEDGNFCDRCTLFVSTPKLDYNKYSQNQRTIATKINQNLDKNFEYNFSKFFDEINALKQNFWETIDQQFEKIKLEFEKIKNANQFENFVKDNDIKQQIKNITNKANNFNNMDNINNMDNVNNPNEQNNYDNSNDEFSPQKSYYFEYKYNSNGIDDPEDEFTTYKDDNTIIKEIIF